MTPYQEEKLVKMWSKIIRSRGKCEICGRILQEEEAHPHHIIGRKNKSTKWWIPNGVCLCHDHHQFAHNEKAAFMEFIIDARGEKWFKELANKANDVFNGYYDKVLKYLKEFN